jgi:N-dimethylarginine dimethylaminohydrolase
MEKIIDLNQSIYELTNKHPEIITVLSELGFTDISKPGMLNTAGRFMTLQKGAALKKISMEHIIKTLTEKGYQVRE